MKAAKTAAKEQTGLALLLLAVIALVIVVIFIFKYSSGTKPNNLYRSITIVLLLMGLPVLYYAFIIPGFDLAWFAAVSLYLALLAVSLLSYIDNRFIGCAGNPGQLVSSIRIVVGEISSYVRIVRVFKQSRPIRESW